MVHAVDSNAVLHFGCATIARSPIYCARSTISIAVSCLRRQETAIEIVAARRLQKTPNMPYFSRPIRRIETLRISELHYVFKHEKQKLFLQPTLMDGGQ